MDTPFLFIIINVILTVSCSLISKLWIIYKTNFSLLHCRCSHILIFMCISKHRIHENTLNINSFIRFFVHYCVPKKTLSVFMNPTFYTYKASCFFVPLTFRRYERKTLWWRFVSKSFFVTGKLPELHPSPGTSSSGSLPHLRYELIQTHVPRIFCTGKFLSLFRHSHLLHCFAL
jgi:hypothetical protein